MKEVSKLTEVFFLSSIGLCVLGLSGYTFTRLISIIDNFVVLFVFQLSSFVSNKLHN